MEFWAQIRPNNCGNLTSYWSQTCFEHVSEFGIWHIYITSTKKKLVLEILSWSIHKIVKNEVHNTVCKSKVSKNQSKHTIV